MAQNENEAGGFDLMQLFAEFERASRLDSMETRGAAMAVEMVAAQLEREGYAPLDGTETVIVQAIGKVNAGLAALEEHVEAHCQQIGGAQTTSELTTTILDKITKKLEEQAAEIQYLKDEVSRLSINAAASN